MSAHVLLNLLNELGKRDKMRGLRSILSLFRNEFNKFNNTRARMLDSIYHMTNTLKSHFWRNNVIILSFYKPLVVYRFYSMALFHSQTWRHMINMFIKGVRPRDPAIPATDMLTNSHRIPDIVNLMRLRHSKSL